MDFGRQTFRHSALQRLTDSLKTDDLPHELAVYLLDREASRCSPRTIRDYRSRLLAFLEFSKKQVKDIDRNDVRLYILSMEHRKLSPFYIKSTYKCLLAFFNWLLAEGMLKESPMANLKAPRMPQRLGKGFISEREFQRLLAVCDTRNFRGYRSQAWLWLLWSTCCRFSELADLDIDNLNWNSDCIRVIGKGDKERVVPFTKPAKKAMLRYLREREVVFPRDNHSCLWLSDRGTPLEPVGLASLTRRLFDRAGVEVKDIHHVFRRTFVMRNLKAGISEEFIKLVGGWSSLSMVDYYSRGMTSEDAMGAKWV